MRNNVQVQTISREVGPQYCGFDPSETTRRVPTFQEYKAYLLGALHDGTYNRYNRRHRFAQKGTEWLEVLKIILKLTGNSAWKYKEGKERSVYILETRAPFLDTNFDPQKLRSSQDKRAYVRGFFDAEGGIPQKGDAKFYIQLVQNNRTKLQKIKGMLRSLGIDTGRIHNPSVRVDPDYWRMYIPKHSWPEFTTQINSWHPRKRKILEERNMI